jgi:hypothetical protein
MKSFDTRCGAALLLALLPLVDACGQESDHQQAIRQAQAAQAKIAALPPECTLGAAGRGMRGSWLNTTKALPAPSSGASIVSVYSFDKPVTTRVLRVALDLQALSNIEKVETRDAQGTWREAGPLVRREAPVNCEYVWLQQELPEARQVDALRFTFRNAPGTMSSANAGVLQ